MSVANSEATDGRVVCAARRTVGGGEPRFQSMRTGRERNFKHDCASVGWNGLTLIDRPNANAGLVRLDRTTAVDGGRNRGIHLGRPASYRDFIATVAGRANRPRTVRFES